MRTNDRMTSRAVKEDASSSEGVALSEWRDYQNLVLHELDRLNTNIEKVMERQTAVALEINGIRARAKAWGTMAGMVAGLVGSAIILLIEAFMNRSH